MSTLIISKSVALQLIPAGASGDRAILMSLAEKGRQLAVLDASYQGAVRESSANMFDIAINKYGADMRAKAQTMLKPSALSR